MPIMCRLLQLSPEQATALVEHPENLNDAVEGAKIYSDVYRYWHAIEYLLAVHGAASPAANWLEAGTAVGEADGEIPAARVLFPKTVQLLEAALQPIEPDDLIGDYDAEALDAAGVYPQTYVDWEETFDPLGQILEHYSFLRFFVEARAAAGDAALFYFTFLDDGSDD